MKKGIIFLLMLACTSVFSLSIIQENTEPPNLDSYLPEENDKKTNQKKEEPPPKVKDDLIGLSLTFKPSYFWPQDRVYRNIYKGGFLPLLELFYRELGTWLEIGYFYKRENVDSVDIKEVPTTITQVPLSIGLSYTYSVCSFFDIYGKIGPNWIYTKTWIDIPGLKHTVVEHVFGGTIGIGGKFLLPNRWIIEILVNYLYDRKKIKDSDSYETFRVYLGEYKLVSA